jgi:CRISPR/Cas system CMR subunit Cmr6 (Cas7 group RAMP superfamily)
VVKQVCGVYAEFNWRRYWSQYGKDMGTEQRRKGRHPACHSSSKEMTPTSLEMKTRTDLNIWLDNDNPDLK